MRPPPPPWQAIAGKDTEADGFEVVGAVLVGGEWRVVSRRLAMRLGGVLCLRRDMP